MIGKHELLCRHYFSGVCTCRADHADDCVSLVRDTPCDCDGTEWQNPDFQVMEPTTGKDEYTPVNHPLHYNVHPNGIECIDVVEGFNFNVGNAIKYLWRAGLKSDDAVKDLEKAAWYVQRELERAKTKLNSIPYSEYRAKRLVEIDTTDTVTDKGDYSGEDVTETVWPVVDAAPRTSRCNREGDHRPHVWNGWHCTGNGPRPCRDTGAHIGHTYDGVQCIGRAYDIT